MRGGVGRWVSVVEEACKGGEWWGPPFESENSIGLSRCVFVDGWL